MTSQIKEGFHRNGVVKWNQAKISEYEKKKENIIKISPADPNSSSFFKRNVPSIANLKEKFKQEKPIESHIHSVLMNSSVGRSSSVGLHLDYEFSLPAAKSLADHDYCRETLFDANVINIDPQKYLNINRIIETKYNNSEPSPAANLYPVHT